VEQLPPGEQELVRQFHFERLTYAEIGERLQLTEGQVKSRLNQVRLRLRMILGE
jgi:RNA polymerase sigma factor (sigma-70 family)